MTNTFEWRKHLKVHAAADLFPLLAADELQELADDIAANGLRSSITLRKVDDGYEVLDGRNRLDALAKLDLLGRDANGRVIVTKNFHPKDKWVAPSTALPNQPFAYTTADDIPALVRSLNIHRRHLKVDEKRDLIIKLLKLHPEKSDRQIAKELDRDHKTVAKVRAEQERRGELLPTSTRTDTKGRKQPAKKPAAITPPKVTIDADGRLSVPERLEPPAAKPKAHDSRCPCPMCSGGPDHIKSDTPEASAAARKAEYAAGEVNGATAPKPKAASKWNLEQVDSYVVGFRAELGSIKRATMPGDFGRICGAIRDIVDDLEAL